MDKPVNKIIGSIGFDALVSSACILLKLPPFPQLLVSSTFNLASTYLKENIRGLYDDFSESKLSKFQVNRLNIVTKQAIVQFYKRVEKDGWNLNHPEYGAFIQHLYESQEHLLFRALQDAQSLKDDIYGALWGNLLYTHSDEWDEQYFAINTLSKLSVRQLILIKLIVENFNGLEKHLSITNLSIVSEINDLKPLFWHIKRGITLYNVPSVCNLGSIVKTDFALNFSEMTTLSDFILEEQVSDVINQMRLEYVEEPYYLNAEKNGNYAEKL